VPRNAEQRHGPGEPEQRVHLRHEQQQGHRVLEARHHGGGDVADHVAEAQYAEERLEYAAAHHDEDHERQRSVDVGRILPDGRDDRVRDHRRE
jgi:hypothetical protein